MPDRYGDDDAQPLVDLDSRRHARENAAAAERARQQRERLATSRAVHAPLSADQSQAARAHRRATNTVAEQHRNALRITNCALCNDDGYRGQLVCDHIDHASAAQRGMAKIRQILGGKQ